jgi:hypothetical protein
MRILLRVYWNPRTGLEVILSWIASDWHESMDDNVDARMEYYISTAPISCFDRGLEEHMSL